jgi:hypothetical protein
MIREALFDEINKKLDIVTKLLAYQTVGKMTVAEGAPILRRLGFAPADIAAVYESTPKAVSVRLAEARKRKQPKGS